MTVTFQTRRADGRSNQKVLIEHVSKFTPGQVFAYEELAAMLGKGVDRDFTREDVQQVVRMARHQLLREFKRTLANVPNVGYQMAHANEHAGIADMHTRRGHRQIKHALVTMENARLDEMTAAERERHVAQCEINQRLYYEQRRITSKQSRQEQLIARLASRVEQLEAKTER